MESSKATSFISLYLKVSGHEAIEHARISKAFDLHFVLSCQLTNRSDPILFYQADEADSHTTPLLHDASVDAFGVLAGLLVDDVGEQPGESA